MLSAREGAEEGLRCSILGPLAVTWRGAPVALGGAKQQMVLALLLLEVDRVVSTERLVEWVWGPDSGERSPGTLQVYVSNLRRTLAPAADATGRQLIHTRRPGYVIELSPDELDASRLDALRARGDEAMERGRPGEAVSSYREALALWRGEPLAGLPVDAAVAGGVGRLEVARLTLLQQLAEAELAVGRHREFLDELRSWVQAQPLDERLRALLMLALYRCGRQADALGVYREGRELLVEQLGIDPSRELRDLESRILAQDESLDLVAARSGAGGGPESFEGIGATVTRSSVLGAAAALEVDGTLLPLRARATTIGRLPDRDVVLDDPGVSRVHAEVRRLGSDYQLVDLGSANGTYVAGEPVREHRLVDGDVIRIGGAEIVFRRTAPSEPQAGS